METSEITEENDEDNPSIIHNEALKERIRRIIAYQKSLYLSSSSWSSLSSSAASCSSFSSSRTSSSLIDLMKGGNTSLKRLFDMERTSLSTYFPLSGSDTDDEIHDPWEEIRKIGNLKDLETASQSEFASGGSFISKELEHEKPKKKKKRMKLTRKRPFRRLPGFGLWKCRRFRCRLRLRWVRIMICGRLHHL